MRLIDADALIAELNGIRYPGAPYVDAGIRIAVGKVCDAPTIEPEPQWIPCSERLPEEYGEYICTMENGQVQECGFVPENQRGLVDGWSTCEADGYKFIGYVDVLAWMPLPEPYKEDTDGDK